MLVDARRAVAAAAGAGLDLALVEVLVKLVPLGVGGVAVFLAGAE